MGSEWQTVQGPKSKVKNRPKKGSDKQSSDDRNGAPGKSSIASQDAVLAQIDADWTTGRLANSKASAAPANDLGSFDQLEVKI